MTPERWRQITEVFHAALAGDAAARGPLLDQACASDAALRAEVDAMLAAHEEAGRFGEPADPTQPLSRLERGDTLGPYRIEGLIGEGGMGVVHLAERSDGQYSRRVAIKRVASAARGADVLRRFGDERQILARLDHANIARFLDSGFDPGGVPYLVMEHVEGVPLTSFCRQRNLAVGQRLALFLKICAAVQHAHQNLVIHRDIKPGNILVTPEGEPKLLDFGIAKVLSDALGGDATATMNRALTLDYASPEQVRGDPVTTASDVYSLGVLLYELLADAKPYEVGERSLTEAIRLVCETIPPPPSRVAPAGRGAELAGDLDSIVGKAMEKAPADRYASVAELAADVSAHLEHQPVKARRPSFGYVARKFVRRHRAGATVAAAILVLLVVGMAAVLWQVRVARRERVRAQQRFEQVRQLANYVIYDLQDGIAKLAGSTELRKQMVERSLAYLDSLAGEAAGDAQLQKELAGAYKRLGAVQGQFAVANLGDREGALRSYGKARSLLEQVGTRHPADAEARRDLARVLLDISSVHPPEHRHLARKVLEESTALWEELVRQDATHESNLRGLASAHFSSFIRAEHADRDKALPHMQRALDLFEGLLAAKPEDPDRKRNVALCHKPLSGHFFKRDPARALEHALTAARLDSERVSSQPHNAQAKLDYSFDLGLIADYWYTRGEYNEALSHCERALMLRRELWESDQPNVYARERLAFMLNRVAVLHVFLGRYAQAAPLLKESITHLQALPSQELSQRLNLSTAYLFLGEVAVADRKDPCPWYRLMAELMPGVQDSVREESSYPDIEKLRDRALQRVKSCPP